MRAGAMAGQGWSLFDRPGGAVGLGAVDPFGKVGRAEAAPVAFGSPCSIAARM
jgi:hypothetical protein